MALQHLCFPFRSTQPTGLFNPLNPPYQGDFERKCVSPMHATLTRNREKPNAFVFKCPQLWGYEVGFRCVLEWICRQVGFQAYLALQHLCFPFRSTQPTGLFNPLNPPYQGDFERKCVSPMHATLTRNREKPNAFVFKCPQLWEYEVGFRCVLEWICRQVGFQAYLALQHLCFPFRSTQPTGLFNPLNPPYQGDFERKCVSPMHATLTRNREKPNAFVFKCPQLWGYEVGFRCVLEWICRQVGFQAYLALQHLCFPFRSTQPTGLRMYLGKSRFCV